MKAFAFQNSKDMVLKTSSGGAFNALVRAILKKEGAMKDMSPYRFEDSSSSQIDSAYSIFGAAWSANMEVVMERITDINEIGKFYGSKYSKADLNGLLPKVRQDLETGRTVIVSGIPCQLNGLKKYLTANGVDISRLYLIDVICHGAPNSKLLNDYLNMIENKYHSKVAGITFRDKENEWKGYHTIITLENGKKIKDCFDADLYIRLFFSLFWLDKGCFSCPFSSMERHTDWTIGDFWGIEKLIPEFPSRKGVSLILANSDKAVALMDDMESNLPDNQLLLYYEKDDYKNFQESLRGPVKMPKLYESFHTNYQSLPFETVVRKYGYDGFSPRIKYIVKKCLKRVSWRNK